MPFAAAVILALALGVAAYRREMRPGTDITRTTTEPRKDSSASLEEQVSDLGYERSQLLRKLAEEDKVLRGLSQRLLEQEKLMEGLKASGQAVARSTGGVPPKDLNGAAATGRDEERASAQVKLEELQKTIDTLSGQRDELGIRAATLETKVSELTQLARDREEALDRRDAEVARQQELLEHDRDIRELMGARDLYIAEVHDVSGKGTDKTYGRIFYTRGKRLIFYAYDLDNQPGIRNASTFQAWGRRGPDKQQALNLGIFYEDNAAKKRWVLKANDAKALDDIDAVFVTVEPNGGSHHPSGKQLLFAYLRVGPNHP